MTRYYIKICFKRSIFKSEPEHLSPPVTYFCLSRVALLQSL